MEFIPSSVSILNTGEQKKQEQAKPSVHIHQLVSTGQTKCEYGSTKK